MGIPSPTIPSFVDGSVVHQADLNALANNLTNLYNYNQGGFRTQRDCVLATQTVGQVITNNAATTVSFNSASPSTNNMWVAGTASQITIQTAGIYWLFCQLRWPSVASQTLGNICVVNLLINGGIVATSVLPPVSVGAGTTNSCGTIANLAAGASVRIDAYQFTGASQTLATDFGGSFIGAVYLTATS